MLGVFNELATQAHACQRCAQVVGNGGQHLRTLSDEMLNLRLHGVERGDRLAQLIGAFRANRRGAQVAAKTPRGTGETLQRASQLARTDPGHQHRSNQGEDADDGETHR
ncbi:hypothetical protein D3C77_509600 [compost metagenome]